jgi:hypothetical protein
MLHMVFKIQKPKAKRLLREWLSAEQRIQFDPHGHFEVKGSCTGTRYASVTAREPTSATGLCGTASFKPPVDMTIQIEPEHELSK